MLLQVSICKERSLAPREIASKFLAVVVFKKVVLESGLLVELFGAAWCSADKGKVFVVGLHVVLEGIRSFKLFVARGKSASIGSILGVNDNVSFHIRFETEGFSTVRDEAAECLLVIQGDLLIELFRRRGFFIFKFKRFKE